MASLSHLGLPASVPPPRDEDYLLHGYPRPQLRRRDWITLNGQWDFAIDTEGQDVPIDQVVFSQHIVVPFAPETARSGVAVNDLFRGCWYRREFEVPRLRENERLILHFGAVDYEAFVHIDGVPIGHHEGGFTPFAFDITDHVAGKAHVLLHVRVFDDPLDLAKPRGKQDWEREPHSIWYPRTTGIWQTVWLEKVPRARVEQLRWTASLERWDIGMEARLVG